MKKHFLIFGVIGAMFVANGWAAGNQSVVVYTCPDGCSVNNDITGCVYPDGEDCGVFTTDVFVSSGQTTVKTLVSTSPRDSSSVAARSATEPVTARAAVSRPRAGASKPVGKPGGPDKSSSVGITCPDSCKPDCAVNGNQVICSCISPNGNLCGEQKVKTYDDF